MQSTSDALSGGLHVVDGWEGEEDRATRGKNGDGDDGEVAGVDEEGWQYAEWCL